MMLSNVQAFIRCASSTADKTSWTKPLARMTYGDCIATGGQLEAREASEGTGVGRPGTVAGRGADGSGGENGEAQGCAGVVGGRRGGEGHKSAASPAPRSAGGRCRGVGDAASGGVPGRRGW